MTPKRFFELTACQILFHTTRVDELSGCAGPAQPGEQASSCEPLHERFEPYPGLAVLRSEGQAAKAETFEEASEKDPGHATASVSLAIGEALDVGFLPATKWPAHGPHFTPRWNQVVLGSPAADRDLRFPWILRGNVFCPW